MNSHTCPNCGHDNNLREAGSYFSDCARDESGHCLPGGSAAQPGAAKRTTVVNDPKLYKSLKSHLANKQGPKKSTFGDKAKVFGLGMGLVAGVAAKKYHLGRGARAAVRSRAGALAKAKPKHAQRAWNDTVGGRSGPNFIRGSHSGKTIKAGTFAASTGVRKRATRMGARTAGNPEVMWGGKSPTSRGGFQNNRRGSSRFSPTSDAEWAPRVRRR